MRCPPPGLLYHALGVHVYEPDRVVVKAIYDRLSHRCRGRAFRTERHKLYRAVLKVHTDARALTIEFRL